MKETFIVAGNAFTISMPDGFPLWESVKARFIPFAADAAEAPTLEINVAEQPIQEPEGEEIFKPSPTDISFVTASVYRLADSSLELLFIHKEQPRPRLLMRMAPDLGKADISIEGADDINAPHFLSHALMIAYMLSSALTGTLLMHAAAVVCGGKAYLFQGKSGTGKSTHARLWLANIPGAELLNDDNPIVRVTADGTATAYGSPWSGKTDCYRNMSAPVGGFVRIVRSKDNELRRLSPLKAYASLTASAGFMPFVSDRLKGLRHKAIERAAMTADCCEMHCRPDADAAAVCFRDITSNPKQNNISENEN